eukprot:871995-Pyramimonas_sp.AAC.1
MGAIVPKDASRRPDIARRAQQRDHALGPARRALIPRRAVSGSAEARCVEALTCSKSLQQVELWHGLGGCNAKRVRAACMRSLRAAVGVARAVQSDVPYGDIQVLDLATGVDVDCARRIRRLKYFERIINQYPRTLRAMLDMVGLHDAWPGKTMGDLQWLAMSNVGSSLPESLADRVGFSPRDVRKCLNM